MEILVNDENMELKVEWWEGIPFLHLTVHKWSHTLFKSYFLPTWIEVMDYLKSLECDAVYAAFPHNPKIEKFHEMVGMHVANRDDTYTLTRRWL